MSDLLRLADLTPGRLRNYLWFLASGSPCFWGPEKHREMGGDLTRDPWRPYGPSGPFPDDILAGTWTLWTQTPEPVWSACSGWVDRVAVESTRRYDAVPRFAVRGVLTARRPRQLPDEPIRRSHREGGLTARHFADEGSQILCCNDLEPASGPGRPGVGASR